MITAEKVEEWIKEVEERPESAPLILRYIANRLRELAERNESLLAENIALLTGKRVEEYERRIAHLEYQLELLKRQARIELPDIQVEAPKSSSTTLSETMCLLIYDAQGHIQRLDLSKEMMSSNYPLGHLRDERLQNGDPPRILAASLTEEILFIFNDGRIATMPTAVIPMEKIESGALSLASAPIPHEPNVGETLACLVPISRIALSEYLVQISRKGYVKKFRSSLVESILTNHYIGTGVHLPADITFDLVLCNKEDRLALVSREGYSLCLEVRALPFSIEETMKLGMGDHLTAALVVRPGQSLLAVTQVGKVIHRAAESLEVSHTVKTKGQSLYSRQRREQGVRVIGAAAMQEQDWGATIHQDGTLTLHSAQDLFGSGAISTDSGLLAFAAFSAPPI